MTAINESSLRKTLSKIYKYRDLTARDITSVASLYKDLKPVMDSYVFNDGSTKELLSLAGTVPVSYRGTESTAFKKRLRFSTPQTYLAIQLYPDESFLYVGPFSLFNIFLFYRKFVQHSHLPVASRHISLQPSHLFCQTHKCHDDKNRETR
uniref:UEV domain-containing protein n=1 Tax=Sinocyclocheilus grahami TaxID=75366 RepID=A0A672SMC4_SINGR